jgi:rare lipoprotein A
VADLRFRFVALWCTALFAVLPGCASRETSGFRPPTDPAALRSSTATPEDLAFAKAASSPSDAQAMQTGLATWYGDRLAGNKTASGEIFDPRRMTAAHRTFKLGTWIEVRRIDTGSSVRVRVNDRGPFGKERTRIVDLSRGAAEKLGMVRDGVVRVEIRIVPGP